MPDAGDPSVECIPVDQEHSYEPETPDGGWDAAMARPDAWGDLEARVPFGFSEAVACVDEVLPDLAKACSIRTYGPNGEFEVEERRDALGRLVSRSGAPGFCSLSLKLTYDDAGRLVEVSDHYGDTEYDVRHWTYDSAGLLRAYVHSGGSGYWGDTTTRYRYQYFCDGRPASVDGVLSNDNGDFPRHFEQQFDAQGRPVSVFTERPVSWGYDELGNVRMRSGYSGYVPRGEAAPSTVWFDSEGNVVKTDSGCDGISYFASSAGSHERWVDARFCNGHPRRYERSDLVDGRAVLSWEVSDNRWKVSLVSTRRTFTCAGQLVQEEFDSTGDGVADALRTFTVEEDGALVRERWTAGVPGTFHAGTREYRFSCE